MNERQQRVIVDTTGVSLTLIACVIYLFIGVVWHLWHPYWIMIAGVIGLSAVAKIIIEAKIKVQRIKLEEELKRIREEEEREANKVKLLSAPKEVKTKAVKPATKTVKVEKIEPINVDEIIELKKAEIRKRTLGVDVKENKSTSIKDQAIKVVKPATQKVIKEEPKTEPIKKVSEEKETTKAPKPTTKKATASTRSTSTKATTKTTSKPTTSKANKTTGASKKSTTKKSTIKTPTEKVSTTKSSKKVVNK